MKGRACTGAAVLSLSSLLALSASGADVGADPAEPPKQKSLDANLPDGKSPVGKLIGGWLATTEIDGKQRGHWLELAADRSWRRIEDHFGFRAENHGHWSPDGDGAVLEDVGVRLHFADGKLLLVYGGETLYAFRPCPTMPKHLGDLPPFPGTLSETVAILAAELSEQDRALMAGTLEGDLVRFHHGLGTYIRNRFGLWGANPALLAACKVSHPDDASAVVLRALRDHLRKTRPGGRELDYAEGLLRDLALPSIPVRQTTAARLVTALNLEIRRALRRKGLLQDALVFELARPSNDDERRRRDSYWLNYPPGLRAWGQRGEHRDDRKAIELLTGFRIRLAAPNRVVLEPNFDPRWYQTPEKSPDFASVRWREDWFEVESTVEEGEHASLQQEGSPQRGARGPSRGPIRTDTWTMLGASPPLPIEQAVAYARAARERIPAAKTPVEIAITAAPTGHGADACEWVYTVRSAFTDRDVGAGAPAEISPHSMRRSEWPDLRKPPRLSPSLALSRFRDALTPSPNPLARIAIRLKRVSASTRWYYEVALGDGDEKLPASDETGYETGYVTGYVTMDGRVFFAKPDRDSARPEQAVR